MSAPDPKKSDPSESTNPDARAVPPRIPEYELLRPIGRGSYGEVWLAKSVTGAYRAVKIVYRKTFDEDRPYEREFRGIQKFEPVSRLHDSQVDVLHVGRNDTEQYFYYVMELADDLSDTTQLPPANANWRSYTPRTLKNELQERDRIAFNESLELGIRLATAVEHLHRHGLVHRDIKPSNIIFVGGAPKLADIGLVAPQDDSISFVGTMGYFPPEGPGTIQADIYSLGKVLYEASTGKDRREFPDPPTELTRDADIAAQVELNEIILKACNRDVGGRYQSAQELKADLLLLQSGKSIKKLRKLERRLAVLTRTGIAVGIVATLAVGGYFYQRRQSDRLRVLEKESHDRAVRLSVGQGVERMEDRDLLGSLVWFTESLRLASDDGEIHRFRIEAVRRECPRLAAFGIDQGQILCGAFSPDGKQILTGNDQGEARLWSIATSEPVLSPMKHDAAIVKVTFSPQGDRIATASDDFTARIWNAKTARLIGSPLLHASNVADVVFNRDGSRVLTASFDQTARVWEVETGAIAGPPLRHTGKIDMAAFSPDGRLIATAARDHTARIWDAETGQPLAEPLQHAADVNTAVFSPDGARLLTVSDDGTSRIWNTTTGEPLTPSLRQRGKVSCGAFSPDGKTVVTGGGLSGVVGEARVWDAINGESISATPRHERPVQSAEYSPDGRWIVTASSDRTARVWDAQSGDPVGPTLKHNHTVTTARFSPNGRAILTISRDRTWRVWELSMADLNAQTLRLAYAPTVGEFSSDGKRILINHCLLAAPQGGPFEIEMTFENSYFARFDPRKQRVLTADLDETARVWNFDTQEQAGIRLQHRSSVTDAIFSPDGTQIATSTADKTARIWDASTGSPVSPPMKHTLEVWQLAFSPDGGRLITGQGPYRLARSGEARIWDAKTGNSLGEPFRPNGLVVSVSFSPDGRNALAAVSPPDEIPGAAYVLDGKTGVPRGIVLYHEDDVTDARYSPDGRFIVTASSDTTARIWDAATGKPIGPALKHRRGVAMAIFSPDGRRLATACSDGTARVWDSRTGEPVSPPLRSEGMALNVAFSPDGFRLLTGSRDLNDDKGHLRIWELPKATEPLTALMLRAELYSGSRIDQTGALVPLAPEELLQRWDTFATGPTHWRR